ncbi:MAG: F0F1 ATP synthase subunit C [Phascolarctobacterium sp.]|nr:F0F1 ATP synthase subunit C [Phascolarctobacterium sp.]
MTENAIITAASLICAGLVCLGAANGASTGNASLCGRTIESMARQPEESGKLMTTMLICVGLVESMPILCYVIAIVLIFANPFIK